MMQDVSQLSMLFAFRNELTPIWTRQVEEKRTPLQISMDELAKKLSIISFAIIGVIVLIGVFQKRSWLEMFTIGG
jgi:magnesium-transporting ATPase (P-type)